MEAQLRCLWAVVTEQVTFCEILPGRGFAEEAAILGAEYAGSLIHDGWQIYYTEGGASELCGALDPALPGQGGCGDAFGWAFSLAVKQLLEQGLALRDRYLEQKISLNDLWTATGRLEAKLDRLLERAYRDPANCRLAKHLRRERPYLFTFLYCPGLVDATNNLAERVMRLLVVIRKNWGGNRTQQGARTQAVLTSILLTARQQDKDVFELLTDLLRSPQPKLLDILPEVEVVTGAKRVDGVATGGRAAGGGPAVESLAAMGLPGLADVSVLPGWLPAAETRPIFSSA